MKFYNFARSNVLQIFGDIGAGGLDEAAFRAELDKATGATIEVEINSPGGDVFAALAIYNMLKASGKTVTTRVMGIAASAASLILMAGDKREMPRNAFVMIHNAATTASGNTAALRKVADALEKIEGAMVATYARASGLPEATVRALLAAETWLTADEALAKGFATVVTDEITASASFDLARAKLPAHVRATYAPRAVNRTTAKPAIPGGPAGIWASRNAQTSRPIAPAKPTASR